MNEDKDLVRRTLSGEREAFEMIIQKYQRPLVNYIARTVGDYEQALEFTQEVFIKSYSSLHSYQPSFKFSTWLFKIASNHIIDYWRKKKVDAISIDHPLKQDEDSFRYQVPSDEYSVGKKFELGEIKEKIETALQKIPPYLRELFVWRHVNNFSYEEMAEIKSLPVGTVKNRVYQAKEMLRKQLEEMT
jgi:RNA polymerase sigma-70 factor (ECF subfamily)